MAEYFFNKNPQTTGEHEVHKEGCYRIPEKENCIPLGWCFNAIEAVEKAKKMYYGTNIDGCYYCSKEAHKK